MIIVMRPGASSDDVDRVVARLAEIGAEAHVSEGARQTVVGAVGDRAVIQEVPWEALGGVERAVPVLKPYRFVGRDFHPDDTVIEVGGAKIGGGHFAPIAGPCAVEITRAAVRGCRRGDRRRSHHPPRRRLQATHLPVLVPGSR